MIRIALCDDDPQVLDIIGHYIDAFVSDSGHEIVCDRFTDGNALLDKLEGGIHYDLVFLDVVMPDLNGIQVGKEIYGRNKMTKIVFLTSSPEFAVESYGVNALDYLLKPLTDEKFNRAIMRFM